MITEPTERTVLLALCGKSPAVITETAYALATHPHDPIRCHDVIALTTNEGRTQIREQLFDQAIWSKLRQRLEATPSEFNFGASDYSIRVCPEPDLTANITDISSSAGATRFADFVMANLRQFTETPGTRVIFSISGGRKTMSALAALAMTLLGRPQDRLCHVLVNPPFDSPNLTPLFYYPDNTTSTYQLDATDFPAEAANLTLHDIPFVRCRHLFQNYHDTLPPDYSTMVQQANAALPATCRIHLAPAKSRLYINDCPIKLSPNLYLIYWMLCIRARETNEPLNSLQALADACQTFAQQSQHKDLPPVINAKPKRLGDDIRKDVNRLKQNLKDALQTEPGLFHLCNPNPEKGTYIISVSSDNITIDNTK
jgi:CRISPR-associated protein (TIGR02584 family)